LEARDFVLNLNYDTTFEIALEQLRKPFAYAPNSPEQSELVVCKPHGSLNMVSNNYKFSFGQPTWLGTPEKPGFKSFSGLIPPRLNKRYDQHQWHGPFWIQLGTGIPKLSSCGVWALPKATLTS